MGKSAGLAAAVSQGFVDEGDLESAIEVYTQFLYDNPRPMQASPMADFVRDTVQKRVTDLGSRFLRFCVTQQEGGDSEGRCTRRLEKTKASRVPRLRCVP
jgi:hypothetical protein